MKPLVPYDADSQLLTMGSQLFFVDPNVSNEGQPFPVAGAKANYPYILPFLAHAFPVRRIRCLLTTQLGVVPPISDAGPVFLTLRAADGRYLLNQIPVLEFVEQIPGFPANRDILFDADFFPDPRYSFLQWTLAGQTSRIALEFIYG